MINLLISAIFGILIANILKLSSKKEVSALSLFSGNYFCTTVLSLFQIKDYPQILNHFDTAIGVILGLFFILNLFIYNTNLIKNGVSLSVSVMRISIIIPVVLSLVIYSENINLHTVVGILMILSVIILLTKSHKNSNILLIILLFLITGITDFFFKIHQQSGLGYDNFFLLVVFISALFFTLLFMLFKKKKLHLFSILIGVLLGIPNYYTSFFFIKALNILPAVICYPINSSLIVLGSFFSDLCFWKSSFKWYQYLLYLGLIISIIVLNVGLYK